MQSLAKNKPFKSLKSLKLAFWVDICVNIVENRWSVRWTDDKSSWSETSISELHMNLCQSNYAENYAYFHIIEMPIFHLIVHVPHPCSSISLAYDKRVSE